MNLSDEELKKERNHLELTTKLLRQNISDLAQDLYDNEEKQQEFKRYVWDTKAELDPTEMKTILSNNDKEIEDLEMKAKYYKKLYKIQNNPYFGKITYEDDEGKNDIYIGLTYLTKGNENVIYDWRSPVSSIFYDYEQGDCQYEAPGGIMKGYIIENSEEGILQGMHDYMDGKVHAMNIDFEEYNQEAIKEFYSLL